jgi:hypothetical protein
VTTSKQQLPNVSQKVIEFKFKDIIFNSEFRSSKDFADKGSIVVSTLLLWKTSLERLYNRRRESTAEQIRLSNETLVAGQSRECLLELLWGSLVFLETSCVVNELC